MKKENIPPTALPRYSALSSPLHLEVFRHQIEIIQAYITQGFDIRQVMLQ